MDMQIVADCVKPDFPKYEYIEAVRSFRGGISYYGGWNDDFCFAKDWSAKPPLSNEDDIEPNLDDIPEDILDEYIALLDFYTTEELENIRKEHGDAAITMLCQSEFGDDYYGMFDCDDEKEDEV